MRVLVVVASKHGSTHEIAEVITNELRRQTYDVDLLTVEKATSVDGYDAVILGSAVYGGNWLTKAILFAKRNQHDLAKVPVWLFSSGPLGAENPQPREDPLKLAAPLGDFKPRDHRIFVGKLDLDDLSFAERMLTKALRAPVGDFRDWDAIRNWAQGIAVELHKAAVPAGH